MLVFIELSSAARELFGNTTLRDENANLDQHDDLMDLDNAPPPPGEEGELLTNAGNEWEMYSALLDQVCKP